MNISRTIDRWRNRSTIRHQLSLIFGLLVFFMVTSLVFYAYSSQARINRLQQQESMKRILDMEGTEIDSYLDALALYAIQLRNDADFMTIVEKSGPMTYPDVTALGGILRTFLYARQDILRVDVWLLRRDAAYSIDSDRRRILPLTDLSPEDLPGFETFRKSPSYLSLHMTEEGLLEVTRTIINAPKKDELAYVRVLVDRTKVKEIEGRHALAGETFFLFSQAGDSLGSAGGAPEVLEAISGGHSAVRLDGADCVLVSGTVREQEYTIAATKPLSIINASLIHSRNRTLLLGILSFAVMMAIILPVIRALTSPLSALEHRLHEVGSGDFSIRPEIRGSSEILSLSREINDMAAELSSLIDRHYLATIGERTAQLAALEAQTNPHFLYNTLQAIGAEALADGNRTVYQMITRLASLLRYSIQGGNLAPLRLESEYAEKYLSLQQARYGERLQYSICIDPELLDAEVPKLSILSLAENSIVHGMKNTTETVTIRITCSREQEQIILRVRDNGCGIDPEKLRCIREQIADPSVTLTENIGLINLSTRVRLLYHGTASIQVESVQEPPRETSVTILIPTGGEINETRADHR